jgi:membrane protease subunit HflC
VKVLTILLVLVLLLVASNALFIVPEDRQAIITQFGAPVGDAIDTPGLKFKLPFIQKAHYFDRRFLEWQGSAEELPTRDKVFIFVDTYARWRISDPLLFFQRLRDELGAQSRLDDILDGETRNAIANHDLIEVIRSSNREAAADESYPDAGGGLEDNAGGGLEEIVTGRDKIRQDILAAAQDRTADLGIEVLDVQFRRINYGQQVEPDVFNRMISERQRIADRFRSQGQGQASEILGNMDRDLKRIESEAYRQATEIRGRADAEATQIYASAYNQSVQSRNFYEFLRTMEAFEKTIDPNTWLVVSTDSDYFSFLKASGP